MMHLSVLRNAHWYNVITKLQTLFRFPYRVSFFFELQQFLSVFLSLITLTIEEYLWVFCRNLSVWDCHMFSHALTKFMYFRKVYRDEVSFPVHHIRDILSWYISHLVVLTLVIWLSWLSASFLYYKAFSPSYSVLTNKLLSLDNGLSGGKVIEPQFLKERVSKNLWACVKTTRVGQ